MAPPPISKALISYIAVLSSVTTSTRFSCKLGLYGLSSFICCRQVRLIGYCTEGSLFLVYEYIESGNLSQHLRGSGMLSSIAQMQHYNLEFAEHASYIMYFSRKGTTALAN